MIAASHADKPGVRTSDRLGDGQQQPKIGQARRWPQPQSMEGHHRRGIDVAGLIASTHGFAALPDALTATRVATFGSSSSRSVTTSRVRRRSIPGRSLVRTCCATTSESFDGRLIVIHVRPVAAFPRCRTVAWRSARPRAAWRSSRSDGGTPVACFRPRRRRLQSRSWPALGSTATGPRVRPRG